MRIKDLINSLTVFNNHFSDPTKEHASMLNDTLFIREPGIPLSSDEVALLERAGWTFCSQSRAWSARI